VKEMSFELFKKKKQVERSEASEFNTGEEVT